MSVTLSSITEHENSRRKLPAWQALLEHKSGLGDVNLSQLFTDDGQRFERYSVLLDDLLVDYSKNLINEQTLQLLVDLANQCELPAAIEQMFVGDKINRLENLPALHTALRNVNQFPVYVDGKDVMPAVRRELDKMQAWVDLLHRGELLGSSGEAITDVISIGAGASMLSSVMATEALVEFKQISMLRQTFVSDLDGVGITDVLRKMNPRSTLILLCCKSFEVDETLDMARKAKQWLIDNLENKGDIRAHLAGVSSNDKAMAAFGISRKNRFFVWDWVGEHYSMASALALPVAIDIGFENYRALLDGMHSMDSHFRTAALDKNMPVIMALLNVWYLNFYRARGQVVLTFDARMRRFSNFTRQLEMQSSVRNLRHDGERIAYSTAAGLSSEIATNGEQSFSRLLHQCSGFIAADLLAPVTDSLDHGLQHNPDLAFCLAQSQSLMQGCSRQQVLKELEDSDLSTDEVQRTLPHRVLEGNRPHNVLLFQNLNPNMLGMLAALYEHKNYVQSVIWDINAFDQSGSELTRKLTSTMQLYIDSGSVSGIGEIDNSTLGLLNFIQSRKNTGA